MSDIRSDPYPLKDPDDDVSFSVLKDDVRLLKMTLTRLLAALEGRPNTEGIFPTLPVLGNMSEQNHSSVSIDGGTVSGISLATTAASIGGGAISGVSLASSSVSITGGSVSGVSLTVSNPSIFGGNISGLASLTPANGFGGIAMSIGAISNRYTITATYTTVGAHSHSFAATTVSCMVLLVGGGGGGSGGSTSTMSQLTPGNGGGAGAIVWSFIDLSANFLRPQISSASIVVGGGGSGGPGFSLGTNGGNSTFTLDDPSAAPVPLIAGGGERAGLSFNGQGYGGIMGNPFAAVGSVSIGINGSDGHVAHVYLWDALTSAVGITRGVGGRGVDSVSTYDVGISSAGLATYGDGGDGGDYYPLQNNGSPGVAGACIVYERL